MIMRRRGCAPRSVATAPLGQLDWLARCNHRRRRPPPTTAPAAPKPTNPHQPPPTTGGRSHRLVRHPPPRTGQADHRAGGQATDRRTGGGARPAAGAGRQPGVWAQFSTSNDTLDPAGSPNFDFDQSASTLNVCEGPWSGNRSRASSYRGWPTRRGTSPPDAKQYTFKPQKKASSFHDGHAVQRRKRSIFTLDRGRRSSDQGGPVAGPARTVRPYEVRRRYTPSGGDEAAVAPRLLTNLNGYLGIVPPDRRAEDGAWAEFASTPLVGTGPFVCQKEWVAKDPRPRWSRTPTTNWPSSYFPSTPARRVSGPG